MTYKIKEQLKQIVGDNTNRITHYCKVKSVDKDTYTCVVERLDNNQTIEEVQLNSNGLGNYVIFPVVGSIVIIDKINPSDWGVIFFSKIDKKIEGVEGLTVKELLEQLKNSQEEFADKLYSGLSNMVFTTPTGPTGKSPLNLPEFKILIDKFKQELSDFQDGINKIWEK